MIFAKIFAPAAQKTTIFCLFRPQKIVRLRRASNFSFFTTKIAKLYLYFSGLEESQPELRKPRGVGILKGDYSDEFH